MKSKREKIREDIDYTLWLFFNFVHHFINRERGKELKMYGISVRNAVVFHTIERLGGEITQKQLAREFLLEQHSVSELVSRMINRGLIKKIKNPQNKNSVLIGMTEKGHKVYKMSIKRKSIQSVMSVLGNMEREKLWTILHKIRTKSMDYTKNNNINVYIDVFATNLSYTYGKEEQLKDSDYELWLLLNRTHHLIFKIRQNELNHYGISARNVGVLYAILRSDKKLTIGELARWLGLESHSVSELISRMSKRGLVQKEKDPKKRNIIKVEVTEKGYNEYKMSEDWKSIKSIISVLTEGEKSDFLNILEKIQNRMIDIQNTRAKPEQNAEI